MERVTDPVARPLMPMPMLSKAMHGSCNFRSSSCYQKSHDSGISPALLKGLRALAVSSRVGESGFGGIHRMLPVPTSRLNSHWTSFLVKARACVWLQLLLVFWVTDREEKIVPPCLMNTLRCLLDKVHTRKISSSENQMSRRLARQRLEAETNADTYLLVLRVCGKLGQGAPRIPEYIFLEVRVG